MKKKANKHATVKIGDYTIPLIGVPESASLEECDLCHDTFPLRVMVLSEAGQLLCPKHAESPEPSRDH